MTSPPPPDRAPAVPEAGRGEQPRADGAAVQTTGEAPERPGQVEPDGQAGASGQPVETGPAGEGSSSGHGSFVRELPVLVLIAVVLALLIKTFLVQAFFIPSGSMLQTLQINDRVLVNKVLYHTRDPHRGEIVVFDTKGTGFEGQGGDFAPCPPANAVVGGLRAVQRFLGVGACGDTDFIKRVIAVPGDSVQCCDPQGRVVVNGHPLDEPYVYADNHEPFCASPPGSLRPAALGDQCAAGAAPVRLPPGMFWVMGDHRGDSSDSRPNGFVPGDKIVGRAFLRVWPVRRVGVLHVPATFQHAQAVALAAAGSPVLAAPLLLVPLAAARRASRRDRRRARGVGGSARRG